MVTVAAVSDVHSPMYLRGFLSTIGLRVRDASLFLMAGDMILHSRVGQLEPVLRGIRKAFAGQIISTFGNEEHDAVKDSLIKTYREVLWLDDTDTTLELGGRKVRIVGTRGSLAEPTSWQKAHIPNILEIYSKRVTVVKELLMRRKDDDVIILLSHYAPLRVTTQGETDRIRPVLMDERMEEVIRETKPNIVIHGHSHNATTLSAEIYGSKAFNVAFPARRSTTIVDLW